ncbi:MAG: sigma-70 family RNA polymerase sigma factor [Verrucomicrobiales bacterium]|nr:sigma-70 family RNA polymerase sigma factor [Verrucomicrobiales bacterium]
MSAPESDSSYLTRPGAFHTTRWSMVLSARDPASTTEAARSLETLCRQYWPPLFAYVRQRGHGVHDAQDLTQSFFEKLLAGEWLGAADQERGRFRSFLLMAMQRFLANEWDRSRARKRGGGQMPISLDGAATEALAIPDPSALSPEAVYEKRWALTLLDTAMRRLRAEHEAVGKIDDYERLKTCLTAERGEIDYGAIAEALGIAAASARSAVHRLRRRYRELVREEVAGTVDDPGAVDDELRAVIAALGAAG